VKLQSIRRRLLLVIPVRILLGVVWLLAAILAGAAGGAAAVGFAIGALGCAFALVADPRARLRRPPDEPLPYPAGAVLDSPVRHVWSAMLPSTLGVNILAAVALAPQPELTAILGGISAGLGLASLLSLSAVAARGDVLVDRRGTLYMRQ
jgi:hypothetical protein